MVWCHPWGQFPAQQLRPSDCWLLPATDHHAPARPLSDCYSFFTVSASNRMTTLTTSPVTDRPLFIAGAPEVNLLCWCFYRTFLRLGRQPHMEAPGERWSDQKLHYLQTANIRRHYTKSQYIYESRVGCNNHLPLSVIPTAHVRWSPDDVGESDCVARDGNENKLFPAEGYCWP